MPDYILCNDKLGISIAKISVKERKGKKYWELQTFWTMKKMLKLEIFLLKKIDPTAWPISKNWGENIYNIIDVYYLNPGNEPYISLSRWEVVLTA